jgi:hypothetical protein
LDALTKLQELYNQRDTLNEHIGKIEALLGAEPAQPTQRRKRGPNKPKEIQNGLPATTL